MSNGPDGLKNWPKKLSQDAIAEALLEVRFDADDLSELVVGRLTDLAMLDGFSTTRLPQAEIPEAVREQDLGLRWQPTMERRAVDNTVAVRIGPHVISYHVYQPYPGWPCFSDSLKALVSSVFEQLTNVKITRMGLRYVNLMQSSKHSVSQITDLNLELNVAGQSVQNDFHFGHVVVPDEGSHHVMTRVSSPAFLGADQAPRDTVAVVDLDVFSPQEFQLLNSDDALTWLERAHNYEKDAFFRLLTPEVVETLKEE